MPEGDFRRPPQLWEQKIANLVAVNAVGSVSGGGTTEVGGDLPPGDGGPAPDPDPIAPTPVAFLPPSTPTVSGTVQGIRVTWDGNNNAGETYPPDAFVEVHVSTTSGFTPSTSTLRGRLIGPGMFTVFGLTAGTTYYARLVGVDAYGNTTTPSVQASSTTGLTTTGDYGTATIDAGAVSFNARTIGGITTTVGSTTPTSPVTGDIWLDSTGGAIVHKRWDGTTWVTQAWGSSSLSANCITATQIAAGAVTAGAIAANAVTAEKINASAITADKIAAGTITGDKIAANTIDASKISAAFITASDVNGNVTSISGNSITSGTITGRTVQSSSGANRIVLNNADTLDFFSSNVKRGDIYGVTISGQNGLGVTGALDVTGTVFSPALNVSGAAVDMLGVYNNNTTGLAPVGIATDGRLRRNGTSTQRIKYDIAALAGDLSASVETARLCDVSTTDPLNILDVAVVEFSVIDDGLPTERRLLGFIAEDVRDKLPIAVYEEPDGSAGGVNDQAMVAALLAVVKEQQATISDLTARVTALEGA